MEFGALPPEITSARMYLGPGAAPLSAAATAWDALATELQSAGENYRALLGTLTTDWAGPSVAMNSAASRYAQWLTTTAAQVERTANHARAAAAAYEAALANIVPPPVIAANRAQLAALVATNVLGRNTAAIMAAEAAMSKCRRRTQPPCMATGFVAGRDGCTADVHVTRADGERRWSGSAGRGFRAVTTNARRFQRLPRGVHFKRPGRVAAATALNVRGAVGVGSSRADSRARIRCASPRSHGAASTASTVSRGRVTLSARGRQQPDRDADGAPSWAQLPTPGEPTWSRITPLSTEEQMPSPLPLAAGRGGAPQKQKRPEPEYGVIPTVVRRHPYGG